MLAIRVRAGVDVDLAAAKEPVMLGHAAEQVLHLVAL
jgi:hypothetical protein